MSVILVYLLLNEMDGHVAHIGALAQDKFQWQVLVNMAMNFRFPQKAGNYLPAERLLASQEGL
jgi:hypothetical protein